MPDRKPLASNIFESEFSRALDGLEQEYDDLVEFSADVEFAFAEIDRLQIGKNTDEKLDKVGRLLDSGEYDDILLLTEEQKKEYPELDYSVWSANSAKEVKAHMRTIDKAVALAPSITMFWIRSLTENHVLLNTKVQNAQPNSPNNEQVFITERPGFFDRLRAKMGFMQPQIDSEAQEGLSVMAQTIQEYNAIPQWWERFKIQYRHDLSLNLAFDRRILDKALLEEMDALDDVSGKVMKLLAVGSEVKFTELRKARVSIAQQIVQAQSLQMQMQSAQQNATNKLL